MRVHFQERPWDLFLVLGYVSTVGALILATGQGLLVAVLLIFVVPGYVLVAALFPADQEIGWIERLGLSFVLSVVIVPLLGLLLNFTPLGIRLLPITGSILLFSVSAGLVAYLRRMRLPAKRRLSATIQINRPAWSEYTGLEKTLTVALLVSLLLTSAILIYALTNLQPGEQFTEFYLLGPEGRAENYPTQLDVSEEGTVILGVANHEFESARYTIQIDLVGVEIVTNETGGLSEVVELSRSNVGWINLSLAHDDAWTRDVTFQTDSQGTWQLQFMLFLNDDFSVVYRTLHLFVTVSSP